MGPLTQIGVSLGASALNKIMGFGGGNRFNPNAHKQDYLLGAGEEAALRQSGTTAINNQFRSPLAQLRQHMAFNRLPTGAIVDAMHGMAQKQGESAANLETGIVREKGRRKLNYLNELKTAQNNEADQQFGRFDFTPEMGLLTKVIMLSNAGMLNPQGAMQ